LILALVFIVVVAVIVGAISSLTLNDLNNTTNFNQARRAVLFGVECRQRGDRGNSLRPPAFASARARIAVGPCWGTTPSELTFNLVQVEIWCETTVNKGSSQSRVVTMYACNTTDTTNGSNCQSNPLLTVVEAYDDYSKLGTIPA